MDWFGLANTAIGVGGQVYNWITGAKAYNKARNAIKTARKVAQDRRDYYANRNLTPDQQYALTQQQKANEDAVASERGASAVAGYNKDASLNGAQRNAAIADSNLRANIAGDNATARDRAQEQYYETTQKLDDAETQLEQQKSAQTAQAATQLAQATTNAIGAASQWKMYGPEKKTALSTGRNNANTYFTSPYTNALAGTQPKFTTSDGKPIGLTKPNNYLIF